MDASIFGLMLWVWLLGAPLVAAIIDLSRTKAGAAMTSAGRPDNRPGVAIRP